MASGMAAMTVGMETATDVGAQMIAPAGNNGVVALKPTVGRVSRKGVMPVARSQDAPGPIARTVYDAALAAADARRPRPRRPADGRRAGGAELPHGPDADAR